MYCEPLLASEIAKSGEYFKTNVLAANPTFEQWVPGYESNELPPGCCPLVVIDAIPSDMRSGAVLQALACERWAVVGAWDVAGWVNKEHGRLVYEELEEKGREQELLQGADLKVYGKGWSTTGDKQQYKGKRLRLWTSPGFPKPRILRSGNRPPVTPRLTGASEAVFPYLQALPSGRHLSNAGYTCWTDGSVKTGAKTAGAGVWFREEVQGIIPPITASVGGEPVIIRGEMGAVVLALRALPADQPATLLTDSLSALWIIRRWLRRDFGYCLDEERHPDVVRELISLLHQRRAVRTDLVWIPSHVGEPGNEVVDGLAKRGVDAPHLILDRVCPDIEFWTPDRELANFLGWRTATTRRANSFSWAALAEQMRSTSKAASTQSLVRRDRLRPDLGAVLQNRDRRIQERAVRRMLQARGFNTPVQAVLSRNSGGKVSGFCPFCKVAIETLGHFQFACKQFKDARTKAHDIVADATIAAVHAGMVQQRGSGQRPELWLNTCMRDIYAELWNEKEGEFKPDGLIIDHLERTVHVLELTRGMEAEERAWRDKIDEKYAAYHATNIFLQRKYRGYRVQQSNFVVGALGSVLEREWLHTLESIGLEEKAVRKVTRAAMTAAVEALDMTLGARQAAREALGGEEAGHSFHPSQRGRPPAPRGGLVA